MKTCIVNGRLVLKDKVVEKNLVYEDDVIIEIADEILEGATIIDAKGNYVSPGFIDVHTHGRYGSDVMNATFDDLEKISVMSVDSGVTSFLPTTMTMKKDKITSTLQMIYNSMNIVTGSKILGVHLEGPFINEQYNGAQPIEYVEIPTVLNYKEIVNDYGSIIRKITLAPENDEKLQLVNFLSKHMCVSIGHSNATYDETISSIDAGITSSTHLFNAMRPFHHRDPSLVGAILNDDRVYTELILDGELVDFDAARLAYKIKGSNRVLLITDSLESTGLPDGSYNLVGQKIVSKNGKVFLEDGTLAGSTLSMNTAVYNAIHYLGCSLPQAIQMASYNPAKSIDEDKLGELKVGNIADIILFDEDINVNTVIINGILRLYESGDKDGIND